MKENIDCRMDFDRRKHRRMVAKLALAFSLATTCACQQTAPVSQMANNAAAQTAAAPVSSPNAPNAAQEVEYKGIKARNYISLISTIKAEENPASPLEDETHKPDYVESRSIVFKFSERANQPGYEASIRIYPVAEFRQAFAVSKGDVAAFDKNLANLKSVIARQSATRENLPELHLYDVERVIAAKVKALSFKNGNGVFFLTQSTQDYATMINNKELRGIFQGLTGDGKYYVTAEFPIAAQGLPDDYTEEFEGYKMPDDFLNPQTQKANYARHDEYLRSIEKLLNGSAAEKFTPNLSEIEKTISSLEANWREQSN